MNLDQAIYHNLYVEVSVWVKFQSFSYFSQRKGLFFSNFVYAWAYSACDAFAEVSPIAVEIDGSLGSRPGEVFFGIVSWGGRIDELCEFLEF